MDKLKICMIVKTDPTSGILQYTGLLDEYLSRYVDLNIVLTAFEKKRFNSKRRHTKLFIKQRYFALDFLRLFIHVVRGKFTILHLQSFIINPLITLAFISSVKNHVQRVVFTVHDVIPHSASYMDVMAAKKMYRKIDALIAHSENNRLLLNRLCPANKKIAIIPFGLYHYHNNSNILNRDELKTELNIPNNKKILLFFGVIEERKGVVPFVSQFPRLLREYPNLFFLIVGRNRLKKGEIENIINKNELTEHVRIVDGFASDEMVRAYFTVSDCVIFPYIEISTSGVLKIAISFKKKIIATKVGELPELLSAYPFKAMINIPFNQQDINSIIDLLNKDRKIGDLTKIDHLLSKLSWNKISLQTYKFYRECLLR